MSLKNVTITLDERTLEWIKEAAAEQGKSVSRFMSDMARQQLPRAHEYEAAMHRFIARARAQKVPLREPGEKLPTRDEIYDRPVFRRR
ncbi:MAG TPA: ribbon-helix-helix protein, CopG family [Steroidobacteraceae bacterium]|nr:ribbon-helix-helix protein, CopG family [Steroidobacteraceae bacterium]